MASKNLTKEYSFTGSPIGGEEIALEVKLPNGALKKFSYTLKQGETISDALNALALELNTLRGTHRNPRFHAGVDGNTLRIVPDDRDALAGTLHAGWAPFVRITTSGGLRALPVHMGVS